MSPGEERAAALLREAFEAVQPLPDTPKARLATITAMERATVPARRAVPRQIWVAAAAVLIAMAGVALTTGLRQRPTPTVLEPIAAVQPLNDGIVSVRGAAESPIAGASWPSGTRLKTGSNGTVQVLVARASLHVQPSSEVERGAGPALVRVLRGAVLAEVTVDAAPLSLETSDVLVTSNKGEFWLSPAAGCRGQTEVRVVSGEVTIATQAGSVTLHGDERWPSAEQCAEPHTPPPTPAPVVAPVKKVTPARGTGRVEAPPAPPPVVEPTPVDPLSRQNELYSQAQSAQQAGRFAEAITRLDQLLREYPSGSLAETALLQKIRWLEPRAPEAARAAATQYLNQFPRGVGRAEAERAVLETP